MNGYIKSGIVTRIDVTDETGEFLLNELFNINLFVKNKNTYLLKQEVLDRHFWNYYKEYLSYTNNYGNSIENSDAYCLQIDMDDLIGKKICLTEDNIRYYFDNENEFIFETDCTFFKNFKIYFIAIYWNTNKVICEDFGNITMMVNNFTRSALKNELKHASWFTII